MSEQKIVDGEKAVEKMGRQSSKKGTFMSAKKHKTLKWKLQKYYRWFRIYHKRVRMTEKELGGRLEAC